MNFVFSNAGTAIFVTFDAWPSWGDLASTIAWLFGISSNNVAVIFIHEAKGKSTLKNEEDLQYFYEVFDPSSGTI